MMNSPFAAHAVQSFLNGFPNKSRKHGQRCFDSGAVMHLECVTPGHEYAGVVRDGHDYKVAFEYDEEDRIWYAECDCALTYVCKHAYAAMLALQANVPARDKAGGTPPTKVKMAVAKAREAPQPPRSPVANALTRALGRKLNAAETDYVRRIQWLHRQARGGRILTADALRRLAPALRDYSWTPLELWPEFPSDDLQLWLYCAWELRRRGMALPEVMQPVTDFSLIEPAMKDWERRKEIEQWRANLASLALTPGPEAEPVDFRLMILPRKAQVQWKAQSEDKFKDLKQAHLRLFSEKYRADSLAAVSEAMPLWLALYQPYDFHTACHLDYDRRESVKALGRILRLPDLAARVVNSDGAPLARPAEPLRYHLHPAQNESDDYRVGLVLADDSPAPPVLLALPGYPALYLTERAVFQGPPPHGFSVREPLRIPAPALECANGVDFLQRLTLDLPPRIVQRTRRVQVAVKLFCELKPTFPGSGTEAVFLRVVAEVAGDGKEDYGSGGWYSPPSEQLRKKEKKTGDDGVIRLLDRSAQRHFPGLLQALDAKWDDYHAKWRVRLTRAFPEVFVPWLEALPPEIEVHLKGELATLRNAPVSGRVRLDVEEAGVDWFDLKVALDVSDLELTPEELNLLLNARGRFVRLGAKGWRRLQFDLTPEEDERLARLGLNARDFTAEPQRLHALQLADEAARKFLPEQQVEKIRRRAAELKTRVTPPVPEGIRAALRPYQIEGFHFLAYLTANRFGGVLADDMGLGKTLQALTWLAWLRKNGSGPLRRDSDEPQSGQTEVQATSSDGHPDGRGGRPHVESGVLSSESGAVTSPISAGEPPGSAEGQMPVATALDDTGQPAAPTLVVCPKSVMENWRAEAERFFPGLVVRLWRGEEPTALPAARSEADLIVLNYAQLRGLSPDIAQHRWHAVVLDEAQYIKNPDSQTAQIARTLQAEHRLALTGTPIENRLLDLWSILAFAMPGALGNRTRFTRSYHQPDDPFARRRLAARVRPFLLRRTKAQVAQDLPDRIEEDLVCEMEGEQKTLYRAEFKRAQQLLLNIRTQQELNEQRFHFLTSLLRLRQICCHPALVNTDLSKAESAKVNALLDLLEPLMDEGHKVLVFSQFVTMLEILRDTAKGRGWPHFYLAGQTENRGKLVQGFQEAPGAAVFLISLKAGGFGLNLTAASYVVLFDPWWNPAVEMQAIDRTHRIGQTSKVMAYRLLIKDSIEQKIRQLQRSKAALVQDVLGEETFAQKLTLEDLRFLFAGE